MLKSPRILYFLAGPVPTVEERNDSFQYGSNVSFRNAQLVAPEDRPEPCDGVAGLVPANYKSAPNGKAVIEAHIAKTQHKEPVAAPAAPAAPATPPAPPAPPAPGTDAGWGKTV